MPQAQSRSPQCIAAIVARCCKLQQLSAAHMCTGLCWGWVRTPPTPLDPRLCRGRWRRLQSPLGGCQRTICTAGRAGRQDFDSLEPGEQLRQPTVAMTGRADWFSVGASSARIGPGPPCYPPEHAHAVALVDAGHRAVVFHKSRICAACVWHRRDVDGVGPRALCRL